MAFCAGLTTQQFRRFRTVLGQASIDSGTTIFREGDPAQNLYTITAGAVKLYKLMSDGRRQITSFLFPGDFFGMTVNENYAYTAETMSPVVLCRFPRRKLEALFEELPVLEKKLLGVITQELGAAQEQMLLLGRKTARERVATFLVGLKRRLCVKEDRSLLFALPMSRSDIADFLGLTIETVSRTLTGLKRDGLIALPDANHVAIQRFDDLRRIAEGI
jgi:CRP/FNR family transcriptional regulator